MKIGPKYKIARRLGANVFEKTQTQKFALREQNKEKKFSRPKSNYGLQMTEKQKVRFTYSITEKQLANYVNKAIESDRKNQAEYLYQMLEKRIDSIVLKSGFAKTRRAARQMVSHAHFRINGKKTTIPSTEISLKQIISVKDSSQNKGFFSDYEERTKDVIYPEWLKVDSAKRTSELTKEPVYKPQEINFDLQAVLQFYKR